MPVGASPRAVVAANQSLSTNIGGSYALPVSGCPLTIIGVASIADAQTGWTGTVTTISTPAPTIGFLNPAIAVQPNGDAYAVWSDNVEGDIQAARYVAATDSWDAPITLVGPGLFISVDVAVDSSGNAFFVLANPTRSGSFILQIHVVRYSPSSGITTTTTLSTNGSSSGQVVTDAAGNAMVVWAQSTGIYAARYDRASAAWSGAERISDGGFSPQVAIDGLNDVTVAWLRLQSSLDTVQAARFDSSTLTWGPVKVLSEPSVPSENEDQGTWSPVLAADAAGNVTVLWARSNGSHTIAQASRFVKATGTWSSVTDLSAPGGDAQYTGIATDLTGNVIGLWLRCPGGRSCFVQAARFDAASASWGGALDLPCSSGSPYPAAFQMDAAGNGITLVPCIRGSEDDIRLEARRYTATSNQWGAPIEVSAAGQAAYSPDIGSDAAGNAIALWFQRVHVGTGRLGAIQSTRWIETPPVAPDPPTDLVVSSVTGNTVTLAWKAPATGTAPTGYVLEGGLTPGSVLASIPTRQHGHDLHLQRPVGRVLRPRACDVRQSAKRCVERDSARRQCAAAAVGAGQRAWHGERIELGPLLDQHVQRRRPDGLQLHVTGAHTGSFPLGVVDTVSFNGVPGGTYTFTLTASNAAGVSPPSNPVTLTVPEPAAGHLASPATLPWRSRTAR